MVPQLHVEDRISRRTTIAFVKGQSVTQKLFLVVQKHFLVYLACVLNDILKQEKVQGCWFVDEKALD